MGPALHGAAGLVAMAAPTRSLLSDLPKGHRFPALRFVLDDEDVARYLDAVQDSSAVYRDRGLAPPLAVAAHALGRLLDEVELAGGTLHTVQELETSAAVPIGTELTLAGRVAQRSERAGLIVSVLQFEITLPKADAPALSGRTTVMVPAGGAAEAAS